MSQKHVLAATLALLALAVLFYFWRRPTTYTPAASSTPALTKKWEFTGSGKFIGALALADDGTVYAPSDDGNMFAIDSSGTEQWKTYIGPTMSSPLVGPDGAIYISNNNGKVLALNRSGIVRWSTIVYEGNTYGKNAGAISRDDLYVHAGAELRALRLSNGNLDWSSPWGGTQWGSVTLLPDGTVLAPGHGRLNALDSRGELSWQFPSLSAEAIQRNNGYPPFGNLSVNSGMAVDHNRTVYAALDRTCMVAIGLDGSFKWELPAKSFEMNHASPVIATDGTIYFGSTEGMLIAANSFGATKWSLQLPNYLRATPVLAEDGSLFVVSGAFLWVISPDGKIVSKTEAGNGAESSPTLAPDGTIYVATTDGKVIAYAGGHGPLMSSPWPKFQADLSNSGYARTF